MAVSFLMKKQWYLEVTQSLLMNMKMLTSWIIMKEVLLMTIIHLEGHKVSFFLHIFLPFYSFYVIGFIPLVYASIEKIGLLLLLCSC